MAEAKSDDLPDLIGRLGEDLVTLVDSKLSLLKVEIKEDLTAYVRGSIALLAGGAVVALGFALVNVAGALLLSMLFQRTELAPPVRYALGFVVLGALYLLVGFVLINKYASRLTSIDPAPERTVAELEQDKRWLEQGQATKKAAGKARRSRG